MPGTKTSGNRTGRRGRRPVQNLHIGRDAAQSLRILTLNARGARGRDDISEEQIVEELIAQLARLRCRDRAGGRGGSLAGGGAVKQDYQRRQATEQEPWWKGITDSTDPRYDRALQLSQFAAQIARGVTVMMRPRRLAYRRRCVEHWRHYLEHGAPPEEVL